MDQQNPLLFQLIPQALKGKKEVSIWGSMGFWEGVCGGGVEMRAIGWRGVKVLVVIWWKDEGEV